MSSVRAVGVICFAFALILLSAAARADDAVSRNEATRLGERMYLDGLLPSGEPMTAIIRGDVTVEGTAFTCVSCHLRSGLGSNEGGVATPATNGERLYRPLYYYYKGFEVTNALKRPAYTDETLAEVIRTGVDPSGTPMNEVMPRYLIDDGDMKMLIEYLKTLSREVSPGVSPSTMKFATVVSDGVGQEDMDAMLLSLRDYVDNKNRQVTAYETSPRRARMAKAMITGTIAGGVANTEDIIYKRFSLSVWKLSGTPDTWKAQLEEYNRNDPVFALVGGIVDGDWRPVHEFCEENRIPCLMPVTDYPDLSGGWYTYYLSKGYYQEGEAAANFIDGDEALSKDGKVVQITGGAREARALAEGFTKTWVSLGHDDPETITLKPGAPLTAELLRKAVSDYRPASLVVWAGPEDMPALNALADIEGGPDGVFVSYGHAGSGIWNLKDELRGRVYITYPYRMPRDERAAFDPYTDVLMKNLNISNGEKDIVKRIYSTIQTLNLTLMDIRGNYYRDNFFDTLAMMEDQAFPLYERISFGPDQRFASKGCYIVQMTTGENPELVKKSDWVIH